MAKPDTHDDGADSAQNGKAADRPTRVLPTNRVAFPKQLDILRAFGALANANRPANNVEVSKVVGIHSATIGLVTPFLADVGLLRKTADGFLPAEEVIKFNQAFKWNPETASHRLAPIISRTWFAEAIIPRLRFNPMPQEDAIRELALVASAGPAFKAHLGSLLSYLEASGLIVRENNHIALAQRAAAGEPGEPDTESAPVPSVDPNPARLSPVATSFVNNAAGVVQFNISVKVDMTEFATWETTRIAAFFAGIAQVLAAKGDIEKQAAK